MQNNKFAFYLFLVILLLSSSIWALERNIPSHSKRSKSEHTANQMENFLMSQKERNTPLTPDLWLSQHTQKISITANGTGAIGGRVTQASGGDPIEGMWIGAEQLVCPYNSGGIYSDPDGYYIIDLLPAGEYVVYTENESVFVDAYWYNKPDEDSADTVIVDSYATTDNIDFSLEVGGKITGLITLPGATSIQVGVAAKNITTGRYYYGGYAYNPSGSSATYVINGLPTGSYKVWTSNNQGYLDEYYNDQPDESSADAVPVTLGLITSNIDFTLSLAGKITGTVTMPGASSVSALLYATDTTTGDYYTVTASGSGNSAAYEIIGLPAGTYRVSAYDWYGKYVYEYYNDKPDIASANPVSVTAGGTTPNIDFTLDLGGIIKGTISSSAKGPLRSIRVCAYSTTNHLWYERAVFTDASGNYRLTALRSGYYKINAYSDTTYASRFYNNKDIWSAADSVLVTAPDSAIDKNFNLQTGGSISGYAYGEGAVPLSGADVIVYGTFDLWPVYKITETSADGSYKIGGLHTGKYAVIASIECDQMWFDNKPLWSLPDSVLVTMASNTPGINFNFPSAVEDEENQVALRPDNFELNQNYPNPFNPATVIEYTLRNKAQVDLEIYNLLGQKVKTLVNEYQSPGSYRIFWDGRNGLDKTVATGIYFYKFDANGVSQTKKMILLK